MLKAKDKDKKEPPLKKRKVPNVSDAALSPSPNNTLDRHDCRVSGRSDAHGTALTRPRPPEWQ